MQRAYSLLTIRAVKEDQRVIEGIASTPAPDRMGDIVEPMGAKFRVPMPLLWQHDSKSPIGEVEFAKPTKDGIPFRARLQDPNTVEAASLRDRLQMAWDSIKTGLVKAVSIGFRPIEYSFMDDGGIRFLEWDWLELSAVTIPANSDAVITTIRSLDTEARAASGRSLGDEDRPVPPAATPRVRGSTAVKAITPRTPEEGKMKKTIAEQISAFEATRQAKAARMEEIQGQAADEGRTKDEAEREEFTTLKDEIKAIDDELVDLREMEKANVAAARVAKGGNEAEGSDARIVVPALAGVRAARNVEKGITFTRLIGARYLAMKNHCAPWDIAKMRFGDTPEVEQILRAAVTPGTTLDSTFASPLVVLTNNVTGEFIELLRAKEVIGRIPGLQRVPFNIQVPRGTSDPTAYWVGQGDVKPLSRPGFDSVTLGFAKIAGIVPMTEELMKFSSPAAETLVRDGLIAAIAYLSDRDFLDPSKAASTGISPASVTNGVTPIASSGTTAAAFRTDFASLMETFADANQDPSGIVIVMTPTMALNLGLMHNSLGNREFPDISMNGGFIEGFPVVTSTNIAATGSSPTDGTNIVAINARDVYLAEEGVEIDVSREASLQMNDSPDSPETASTVLVSLWQRNMVALKAERYITWQKKHTTAVGYISYAKYAA